MDGKGDGTDPTPDLEGDVRRLLAALDCTSSQASHLGRSGNEEDGTDSIPDSKEYSGQDHSNGQNDPNQSGFYTLRLVCMSLLVILSKPQCV